MSGFCTPIDGICPDPKDDKIIYGNLIISWGVTNFVVFALIGTLVFSTARSTIERRYKSIEKPKWIGYSVFILFTIWGLVKAALAVAMVNHNTQCCEAELSDDSTSWLVADVFFVLMWFFEYVFALSIIKSRNFILQICLAIIFGGIHAGVLIALGFIWNQLAFWFFLGVTIFDGGAILVALWSSRYTKSATWTKMESDDAKYTILDALSIESNKREILENLGLTPKVGDNASKQPPQSATIDMKNVNSTATPSSGTTYW